MPIAAHDAGRRPRGGVVETLLHGTAGSAVQLWGLGWGDHRDGCCSPPERHHEERRSEWRWVRGARVSACQRWHARVSPHESTCGSVAGNMADVEEALSQQRQERRVRHELSSLMP